MVARGSLKTVAYHSLPNIECENTKIFKQNVWQNKTYILSK